jgi:predicted aspartyl protease
MPATLVAATQKPAPPPETGMMLIDTGASKTTVCENAIQKLGVSAVGVTQVLTPSGVAQQLLYPADILFVGFMPKLSFATVIGSPHLQAQNILGLVGRDLLAHMQLVYNGPMGCVTLSV